MLCRGRLRRARHVTEDRRWVMSKRQMEGEGWSLTTEDAEEPEDEMVSRAPEDQRIRIRKEKRKKGKVVTIVGDVILAKPDMKDLARALRNALGIGGTAREDFIELQGDCQDRARAWLTENGWRLR